MASATAAMKASGCATRADASWRRGFEGQRIADPGGGRFLDPLTGGDRGTRRS